MPRPGCLQVYFILPAVQSRYQRASWAIWSQVDGSERRCDQTPERHTQDAFEMQSLRLAVSGARGEIPQIPFKNHFILYVVVCGETLSTLCNAAYNKPLTV